jgi:hypothetical protein
MLYEYLYFIHITSNLYLKVENLSVWQILHPKLVFLAHVGQWMIWKALVEHPTMEPL